jgi:hypothetical protein
MTAVTIWLLISLNSGYSSAAAGHYTVIERFPSAEDCAHVQRSLPYTGGATTRCIQARVMR